MQVRASAAAPEGSGLRIVLMAERSWNLFYLGRIDEAGYPFATSFPRIKAWFDRARARPSFQEAIARDLGAASRFMRVRGAIQNVLGRGLRRVAT